MASNFNKHQVFSRSGALLTTVSAVALLMSAPLVHARSLNGGSAGGAVSAPNIAADAAAQAARQAAAAAQQSQQSLARAARAVQDIQAVQSAARAAAAAAQVSTRAPLAIPNGLGAGGLDQGGYNWNNAADTPTQSVDGNGQTQVNIRQRVQQAILNWESFNIGARTTLTFDQGGNSSWVALNRVNNATAPSQILGNIKADGHVYVINRSGIIFGGNSQVNVGSLIASTADIDDAHFRAHGIFSAQSGNSWIPSFTAAGAGGVGAIAGKIFVEAGATINTRAPSSVTSGGGFVLMMGTEVSNAGSIGTPKGQTILAAGDSFNLRQGFTTAGNAISTTRGIEIAPTIAAGATRGIVGNSGLIFAQQGDITLAGRTITQDGALIATTSVNTRGTIHLLNATNDGDGSITLDAGSLTAILPELDSKETALNGQRDALIAASATANAQRAAHAVFNNLSLLADRQDQSRIEIVTGGNIVFKGNSYTAAQGGQIAATAGQRIFTEDGARLDVSGVRNVALTMESNNVKVNVQGNELRDSPQNRDSDTLKNNDVWIDVRTLTLVPDGTGGYNGDRYYTAGGLLEVGGYLTNTAHGIGEWTAVGGTITLSAPEVIAQRGAVFDISGGSLDYAGGWLRSTNLIGNDGRRYSVDNAPGYLGYAGYAGGFRRTHNIQGQADERLTEIWTSVFDRGRTSLRWEDGYTVGRDAGRLNLSAATSMISATIVADTVAGTYQANKRSSGITDGYKATQTTPAQNGTLAFGRYTSLGRTGVFDTDVRIGDISDVTAGLDAGSATPAGRANTLWLDAGWLKQQQLGGLDLATSGSIVIDSNVEMAVGGKLNLVAPIIDIAANITVRGGDITASNSFRPDVRGGTTVVLTTPGGTSRIDVRTGSTLDVTGLWVNALLNRDDYLKAAYVDGGVVLLQNSRDVSIASGSVIDVSSGAALQANGTLKGGAAGNITLEAGIGSSTGDLQLDGRLQGFGVSGSGTLRLGFGRTLTIGTDLDASLFRSGFANYEVITRGSLTVASGTHIEVERPVYRPSDRAFDVATGAPASAALELWTPPVYTENPRTGLLEQRDGASVLLQAGNASSIASATVLHIADMAAITVDPGQAITLRSAGQLTVDGRLQAAGGRIELGGVGTNTVAAAGTSVWIGERAVLDVAGRAVTAQDLSGRRYGSVGAGGSILIGNRVNPEDGSIAGSSLFVVVREGALLDASGAHAVLDVAGRGAVDVTSNGGEIVLASSNGLYLDGTMRAQAGGKGAAGGSLTVGIGSQVVVGGTPERIRRIRELIVAERQGPSLLPQNIDPSAAADGLVYGHARLGVDKVRDGGFDTLTLHSSGMIAFDGNVDLSLGLALNLYAGSLGWSEGASANSHVKLAASIIRVAGSDLSNSNVPIDRTGMHYGDSKLQTSQQAVTGSLELKAGLIDVVAGSGFGTGGRLTIPGITSASNQIIDRRGFDQVSLISSGDLRFGSGRAYVTGGLNLAAAQIYPVTGANATIIAGWRGNSADFDPARILTISRTTGDIPNMPYSAFGQLTLDAARIDQGGIIRAPLGTISFGRIASYSAKNVNLLPSSITSTSSRGLVMPYGGTVDGIDWLYDGNKVALEGAVSATRGVFLYGESVDVREGALIDLSGGGDLKGAGFVSGRGGSVDVLRNPLIAANPANGYSADGNAVYAIVPSHGAGYAPVTPEVGTGNPLVGQQITLDGSIPGLPAGTYTLMPATYALLPGAFRVEIPTAADPRGLAGNAALPNGSYMASGRLGFANTAIRDSLSRQVILTSANVVRTLSQFNETTYAQFAVADAARLGTPRAMMPLDGKSLHLYLRPGAGTNALQFDGAVDFSAATGGYAGSANVTGVSASSFEILAAGQSATAGFSGVSLYADDLNALAANRLTIGATAEVRYGQQGNYFTFLQSSMNARNIILREGTLLRAAEVLLVQSGAQGAITIEAGAGISTLGMGATPFDSRDGFIYTPQPTLNAGGSMLAVSNGVIEVLPSNATVTSQGAILIGTCGASGNCNAPTTLYSEGTIAFATTNRFELGDNVRYGTRNLSIGVGALNIGTSAALAAASAAGVLPSGLMLNQEVLDRLLRGDVSAGAPALESLKLNASSAVNIFGTVTLDTYAADGTSRIANLVFGTPAIYGAGSSSDVATIRTENLVWSGLARTPGSVIAGGAGTGQGALNIDAERITFGYGPNVQISGIEDVGRLALGFAQVNLNASERITANHKGSVAFYQSQGAYVPGEGYSYTGGNLTISAPLLTGEAGSVNSITAGGAISVVSNGAAGTILGAESLGAKNLGAELALTGQSVTLASAVVLPSGRFTVSATGNIVLTDAAQLDLSGREVSFDDVKKFSWGGDVVLESKDGDITQHAGAVIDLSAKYNHAGRLTASALGSSAGTVDLAGRILGSAGGQYDAGGTLVPYRAGFVDIRAQHLGGTGTLSDRFAALNARLNDGNMTGGRGFQLKQGDLVIGNELRASEINVSLDSGHLTVTGTVDASGAEVGIIRLAAKNGLTIAGSALLDAHGTILRVDSYGKIIDSPNRAIVELSSGTGRLTLASGARIDLRHGTAAASGTGPSQHDGVARGTLELNVPRLGGATSGDVDIDASGSITIQGARSIAVNAVQRYSDAAYGTDPAASGRPYQQITQAYLDQKHNESILFVANALGSNALMNGKLAGLNNAAYRDAFHLRSGVEIVSATADGDLVVVGDLDLSGYRYQGVNPNFQRSGIYGSGEVGKLTIRAGGNLDIYGSINDGFAPPPETPDNDGWLLRPGLLSYGGDVVVPNGNVTLADGTTYPAGRALNYNLPIKAMTVPAGTQLPVEGVLNGSITLPANTILAGDIFAANGTTLLYAKGTRLAVDVTLAANTRLGAGFIVPVSASLRAMIWPKGVALPAVATINGDVTLPMGGLIPSQADLKLPADAIKVNLRPADSNGRQGANWAVASMLPAGSQSWSMRFVAGADIEAADTRMLRPRDANGHLTLADTHFSKVDRFEGGGVWYWAEGNYMSGVPGTPVDDWALDPDYNVCLQEPGQCVKVSWLWAPGNQFSGTPGKPVDEWALDPSYNVCLAESGQCVSIGGNGVLAEVNPITPMFSVLRTGIGDLDIVTGGNIAMRSSYGVYTAGTQSRNVDPVFSAPRVTRNGSVLGDGASDYESLVSGADATYRAWYPELGGNLLLKAGGNLTGDSWTQGGVFGAEGSRHGQNSSADPANWLWRQGDVAGAANGAAWWINFGSYVAGRNDTQPFSDYPYLVGFTGYGTLGGGDLQVDVRGGAGTIDVLSPGRVDTKVYPRSQGLVLAVASTGRVNANGELLLTGGGDMDVRIGGGINPNRFAHMEMVPGSSNPTPEYLNLGLSGLAANLRGHAAIQAGAHGNVELRYGPFAAFQDPKEVRAYDPFTSTWALAGGGLMLMPGDSTFSLTSRGDLVAGGVWDGGRLPSIDPAVRGSNPWFSLWTDRTSIDLFAAGGNLTPSIQLGEAGSEIAPNAMAGATGARFVYPAILRAAAPSGSIYAGASAVRQGGKPLGYSLMLAPSPYGELELLAGNSIYAGGHAITRSSADVSVVPTPFNPATMSNLSPLAFQMANNMFAFGPNTASGLYDLQPARFYALSGDIVGLRTGEVLTSFTDALNGRTLYEAGGPVWIKAGRDIVNSGTNIGQFTYMPTTGMGGRSTGNLIAHSSETDVSIVSAGRDIIFSSFDIAGPGTLEVTAARNIRQEDRGAITSLGSIIAGDNRPGASVFVAAGMSDANWAAVRTRYLDPANLANPDMPLADQPGKAVKSYGKELADWLKARYGHDGSAEENLAYFDALAPEQQRIFLREIYYAELRAGGRDYNDPTSKRFGSYLRGREMIATLFPEKNADGSAIVRTGDITLFSTEYFEDVYNPVTMVNDSVRRTRDGSVRTLFGGDIQMMAPGDR
ncbi:filamentous hemagglutinin N-terminal domain-containing protein [Tardiphaga alba]|uniref:filamentous hemagglutinin N-terminal domain-containing protein n=1 Tax=Tardiphaga alba TaxID=340268 RepID=UPI001BA8266F|nr:filamentous hemagglutinin N-terminal domain-containing protein [Tardiphaga alba]